METDQVPNAASDTLNPSLLLDEQACLIKLVSSKINLSTSISLSELIVPTDYLHSIVLFHSVWKTGLPVRSAVLKPHAGELVVGWVTTSESSLLYVFVFCFVFVLSFVEGPRDRDEHLNQTPRLRSLIGRLVIPD
ncbi:L-lysine 2-3-aminomutase [Penicillium chrysogenum]|uniref:L-lysine 2-3-aminomutase n=1 Tax=Penicillium chrysogenum TaxID=5076 RepID=A0ABQ8W7F7_PENCH|nr:L-lysine 2-3-aminomutase [Penicillium chrysogenum]